jgi:hypothetical protein
MKKKNDFKRKNIPPERDDHKEKRAAIPPAGDIQQEIREMRQAMLTLSNLPFECHHPIPPSPILPEAIPDSIEDLYWRLKELEERLERLEQRVSANPYDPERRDKYWPLLIVVVVYFVLLLMLSGC